MTLLYVITVGIIIFLVIKGILSKSDPTAPYLFKPIIYVDLETGERYDVQVDYTNPSEFVHSDPDTGETFVLRESKMFDRGPKNLFLENYQVFDFTGWYLVMNKMGVLNQKTTKSINTLLQQVQDKDNMIAHLKYQVDKLIHKQDEVEEKHDQVAKRKIFLIPAKTPDKRR